MDCCLPQATPPETVTLELAVTLLDKKLSSLAKRAAGQMSKQRGVRKQETAGKKAGKPKRESSVKKAEDGKAKAAGTATKAKRLLKSGAGRREGVGDEQEGEQGVEQTPSAPAVVKKRGRPKKQTEAVQVVAEPDAEQAAASLAEPEAPLKEQTAGGQVVVKRGRGRPRKQTQPVAAEQVVVAAGVGAVTVD